MRLAVLLFGLSDRPEPIQSRPILGVRPLRPAPEAALAQIGAFFVLQLAMQVGRVFAALVYHQHQLVVVTGFRLAALDLRCEVGRGDLDLQHGHVPL
jgi:hypothetical protein